MSFRVSLGLFFNWIQALGIKIVENKATLNITTDPGFKDALNLGLKLMKSLYFFVGLMRRIKSTFKAVKLSKDRLMNTEKLLCCNLCLFDFIGCVNVNELTLPKSLKEIEKTLSIIYFVTVILKKCFKGCVRLQDVKIPNTLLSIESKAFARCIRLKPITIPQSVKSIATDAFEEIESEIFQTFKHLKFFKCAPMWFQFLTNKKIKVAIIPNGIEELFKRKLFGIDSLTFLSIPDSVDVIQPGALACCAQLRNVKCGLKYFIILIKKI
ncbi:hypothetical protein EIN_532390 [Entamoeba invadens IP1]|uniref:Leucine rich repeat containing protein BspA family protein n=1 Tax=Entamoeba invadens IP1 TaxID=370355 RepID=L7FLI6_ENTIV|nr:hypothetical protein EIN_532390 [Entamoeba invadens IP1]ELP88729.1 hypothetical protein EIN_532390 [Entamoeba invadens IP1]|eukprot:XP_004255500.1 hypothetical protein EIN_532390 [Entamoeba invadens IP1]